MAQRLYTMANGSAAFDSILRNFNDEQIMQPSDGKPVMQQQQQIPSLAKPIHHRVLIAASPSSEAKLWAWEGLCSYRDWPRLPVSS